MNKQNKYNKCKQTPLLLGYSLPTIGAAAACPRQGVRKERSFHLLENYMLSRWVVQIAEHWYSSAEDLGLIPGLGTQISHKTYRIMYVSIQYFNFSLLKKTSLVKTARRPIDTRLPSLERCMKHTSSPQQGTTTFGPICLLIRAVTNRALPTGLEASSLTTASNQE